MARIGTSLPLLTSVSGSATASGTQHDTKALQPSNGTKRGAAKEPYTATAKTATPISRVPAPAIRIRICQLPSSHELSNTLSYVSLGVGSPVCECRSRHVSRLYSRAVSQIKCYCFHNSRIRNVQRSCQSHLGVARHSDRRWKRLCGKRKDRGSRAAHGPVGSHIFPTADHRQTPRALPPSEHGGRMPRARSSNDQPKAIRGTQRAHHLAPSKATRIAFGVTCGQPNELLYLRHKVTMGPGQDRPTGARILARDMGRVLPPPPSFVDAAV